MKKVYQTLVDKDKGNCMQAAIASLLDKELDEIPNFLANWFKMDAGEEIDRTMVYPVLYLWSNGFEESHVVWNKKDDILGFIKVKEVAKADGGVNGYFYAVVPSQTYEGATHAVIVDTDLNIVHDPNPNQKALDCKPEDINYIIAVNDCYIDINGNLVKGSNYKEENGDK